MNVLQVKPKAIIRELANLGASPVLSSDDDVLHASINVIDQAVNTWQEDQEIKIIELKHQHMIERVQKDEQYEEHALNVSEQIRSTEDELRRAEDDYHELPRTSDQKLEDSARKCKNMASRYDVQRNERRTSALHIRRQAGTLCKKS